MRFEEANPAVERGIPRCAKALRPRLAAQIIGADGGHADRAASVLDAARVGERFDEAALALLGPAVVANPLAGHGIEGGELSDRRGGGGEGGGLGCVAHARGWITGAAL